MTITSDMPRPRFQWLDTPQRYGLISRLLHWSMAALLIWQFLSILLYRLFEDVQAVTTVLSYGPSHGIVGLWVLALVLVRGGWGLFSARRRRAYGKGFVERAAALVHIVLYGLMFFIPAVALLRSYGSGRGWKHGAVQIIPTTGERIDWMVLPGNLGHGLMAWVLCGLIAAHALMAIVHHVVLKDDTLRRMAG